METLDKFNIEVMDALEDLSAMISLIVMLPFAILLLGVVFRPVTQEKMNDGK